MKTLADKLGHFPVWMLKDMRPQRSYKELLVESYGRRKGIQMLKASTGSGGDPAYRKVEPLLSVWNSGSDRKRTKSLPLVEEEDLQELTE